MTPQQRKQKALNAWLDQMAKYAEGPVVGEKYCHGNYCYLCAAFNKRKKNCPGCPLELGNINCICYPTFNNLIGEVRLQSINTNNAIINITPELTAAMTLRHKFYVRGYNEVLKNAAPERFTSGEGFPELLKIDRELIKEIDNEF